MVLTIAVLVVLAQIALFQFVAALANRSVILEETSRLTFSIPKAVTDHGRTALIVRMGLGILLASVLLGVALGPIENTTVVGLLIVGVSMGSAVAFAIAQERDRKIMRELADSDPDGGLRRASLEPRTFLTWYHPAIELVPLVVFLVTAVFLWSAMGFGSGSDFEGDGTRILVYFGLQGAVVAWGLYRGLRPVVGIASIASYIPSLRKHREDTMRLGEQLESTQLKFFLLVKIGISAMAGVLVVKNVLRAAGSAAVASWGVVGWCIVGVLVILYGFYFRRVGRITRQMQKQMG